MESFNAVLGAIISVVTIVTSVVSGLWIVHGKLQSTARIQKSDIIKKIKEQDERLRAIELNMLKVSDEWFKELIKKVEKKVDSIDEDQLRRDHEFKARLSKIEHSLASFPVDNGRIIDLDKERYDSSHIEKKILIILERQSLQEKDIKLLKKVLASHQFAIKHLSSGGKS